MGVSFVFGGVFYAVRKCAASDGRKHDQVSFAEACSEGCPRFGTEKRIRFLIRENDDQILLEEIEHGQFVYPPCACLLLSVVSAIMQAGSGQNAKGSDE